MRDYKSLDKNKEAPASSRIQGLLGMLGTSGRIDSEHLMDVPRGFTPPLRCAGVQIAISICRTEMPLLADLEVQTKTPT